MTRSPFAPALALLLVAILFAPATAMATTFSPLWMLSGWTYGGVVGNLDGDPQPELIMESKLDHHLALVDGLTGAIEKEFPEFKVGEVTYTAMDVDGDSRLELIVSRIASLSGPVVPLTTAYEWTAGSYVTLFSHTDPITQFGIVQLRSTSQYEMLEQTGTDVRVRDMAGNVLFRASTAVAPWSGVGVSIWLGDLDGDGISELGVIQHFNESNQQTLFFHYNAGFAYTWSATSWFMTNAFSTDGDASAELLGFNLIDGRYAFFNGLTGASELELPEFTSNNNSEVIAFDVDGDGRQEIFASRPASAGVTPLFRAYKWVTGSYVPMFSHTEDVLGRQPVPTRSTTQREFLEVSRIDATHNDLVLRDVVTGTVLFRASTQIPGWSGANMFATPVDLDHDGVAELDIQDDAAARMIRYSAGAYAEPWASTAWKTPFPAGKVDDNAADGVFAFASGDDHFGLLDGFTGAVRKEFPGFLGGDSGVLRVDFDHDGKSEIMMVRNGFSVSPLTTCYRWNGSSFATLFSNADSTNGIYAGAYRSHATDDLLEIGTSNFVSNDLRIRASDGTVVFRASTGIPGWSGVGMPSSVDTLDVDHDGIVEFMATDHSAIRLMRYGGTLGVANTLDGAVLRLAGSSPNPFRASTTIRFSTRNAGDVGIAIYDAGGRLVRRLDQRFAAGSHEVNWDGRDGQGHAVPNGVLFYDVRTAGVHQTRKLVRIGR